MVEDVADHSRPLGARVVESGRRAETHTVSNHIGERGHDLPVLAIEAPWLCNPWLDLRQDLVCEASVETPQVAGAEHGKVLEDADPWGAQLVDLKALRRAKGLGWHPVELGLLAAGVEGGAADVADDEVVLVVLVDGVALAAHEPFITAI